MRAELTRPEDPIILAQMPGYFSAFNLVAVDACGHLAYCAGAGGNMFIVDLTNPATPVPLGQVDLSVGSGPRRIAATSELVFVAEGDAAGTLEVYPAQCAGATSVPGAEHAGVPPSQDGLRVQPNPARGWCDFSFHLASSGRVTIEIYDVAGRRVRLLEAGWHAAEEVHFRWDGRNDTLAPAAPGVYLARVIGGEMVRTGRFVLVR